MLPQLFPKRILDDYGSLGGATGTRAVRADDDLHYVAKDDVAGVPSVRASEFFWLSVAHVIGLPAASPEILERAPGHLVVATRREFSATVSGASAKQAALLSGQIQGGGRQLSRILAYDLFASNWDRHADNYLVLDNGGQLAVFAIDFSHVMLIPDLEPHDPVHNLGCPTRGLIGALVAPYGADVVAAVEIVDRLAALQAATVRTILTSIPDAWLDPIFKTAVLAWWEDPARIARADLIRQGLQNGSYL